MATRASTPLVMLAVAALAGVVLALAGCGSSGDSTATEEAPASTSAAPPGASAQVCKGVAALKGEVRATGVSCSEAKPVVAIWNGEPKCHSPSGASHYSCKVSQYTCFANQADAGIVVSCSRPGRSVSFISKPR